MEAAWLTCGAYDPRALGPWVTLILLVIAAGLASAAAPQPREAPGFQLRSTGLEDGAYGPPVAFSLEDYRGRVLVIEFMAVTCAPCRDVVRDVLRPLHAEYGARPGAAFLSVDAWADATLPGWQPVETAPFVRTLQNETGATWRHALDTNGMAERYGALQLPRLVVVGPAGHIAYVADGVPERAEVAAVLDRLLG